MDHRGQKPARPPQDPPARLCTKKNSTDILSEIERLWRECLPAFGQQRVAERAQALSLSSLLCLGRHTVTGLLTTCGQEFHDWSADYRLFSQRRFPTANLFSVIRRAVLQQLPAQAPLRVAVDDSLLRKTGRRIPGAGWRRDPLGPHFQTNFVFAQRVLQFSASVPLPNGAHRMVPISFLHAPTPVKPSSRASAEELKTYRNAARQARVTLRAAEEIAALRQALDAEPDGTARPLQIFGDGGYTNETILKKLPANTTFVGRIRKDAKLYFPPDTLPARPQRGRPRRYGALAPTPEQRRIDESIPWLTITITIHGTDHQVRIKHWANLLWRTAGLAHALQLVVVAPLGYRLRKNSKLLYHKPAFLICTDPHLDVSAIVQGYVQRWDIEVNFREEKTLLGVGQAQVRHPDSVEAVPALQVASYAMLLLATLRAFATNPNPDLLPPPKWAAAGGAPRFSTQRAVNQLRAEVWGRALGITNFSDFASRVSPATSPEKFAPSLSSAVFYAAN